MKEQIRIDRASRPLTLLATCLMLLIFAACGKQDVPTQPVTVKNETTLTVAPESFMSLIKAGEHLVITVQKECRKNDYMDDVDVDENVQFKVQIYESPRLIKANVAGLAGQRLHIKFCQEYLYIQTRYANGYYSAQQAVVEMVFLMKKVQADTEKNSSKFQRWLSDWSFSGFIEDMVGVPAFFLIPYNNIWGKFICGLFYIPAYFFVAHSSSAEGLIVKIFLILLAIHMLLLLIQFRMYAKNIRGWAMRLSLIRFFFLVYSLILLLIASYFVARPVMENVFVLKDVYHINTNILASYYKFHLHSVSILMVVIAIIVFVCTHYLNVEVMTNMVVSGEISEDMAMENTKATGERAGKQFGVLVAALVLAPFFEQSFMLAIFLYLLLTMILELILNSKTIIRWIYFHKGAWYTIIGALVVLAFII